MKRSKRKFNIKESIIAIIIILLSLIVGNLVEQKQIISSDNISNEVKQANTNTILNEETPINETKNNTTNTVNISISNIPPYLNNMVIDINNNIPYFTEDDMKKGDFEYYSNLDELNRAGVAYANICKLTMPPKDTRRESLSYKPTGWNQYLYGENNSQHLYERCHLIAWQLGNENNNKRNLITGTSQLNQAMIEYENMIANWIKNKNKENKDYHVLYRVTPIYQGENKVATGVEIEAKSVEEEGISFNKFIYNVQDNFEIDYYTGKAKLTE